MSLDFGAVSTLFNLLVKCKIDRENMTTDQLSATFSALADPTRRAILSRLALGETSVLELAKPFKMSLQASLRVGAKRNGGPAN